MIVGQTRCWERLEQVIPLVAFYSAACLVLESFATPPDADIVSEWPGWQGRSWRQPGIHDIGERLGDAFSAEAGSALAGLVAVLVEQRELSVPEWNGVIRVARQAFGRDGATTVILDGPIDLDSDIVKQITSVLDLSEHMQPQHPPTTRQSVEAVLIATIAGVLGV